MTLPLRLVVLKNLPYSKAVNGKYSLNKVCRNWRAYTVEGGGPHLSLLTYKRDNLIDTLSYSTTEAYSLKEPLPSIEELKKNNFYIHYVPKIKSDATPFKDRVFISNNKVLESIFDSGWFSRMIFILILGYILSRSNYRKRV